jgi:hypothetical protein
MPVYSFDRSEDGELSRGDYEMEFANVDEACREAVRFGRNSQRRILNR